MTRPGGRPLICAAMLVCGMLCCLFRCSRPLPPPDSGEPQFPPDVVAMWDGGQVDFATIEARMVENPSLACASILRGEGETTQDDIVACYRDAAQTYVLTQSLLNDVESMDSLKVELENQLKGLTARIMLETCLRHLAEPLEVTDAEIERRFSEAQDSRHLPGRRTLWNIFRHHEDPDHPEATMDFLRGLKARIEKGENFSDLARAYSESETRARGGRVGVVKEGRLPENLEKRIAHLPHGAVSDPILVAEGAVLLMVTMPIAPTEFSLPEIRDRLRQEILQDKLSAKVKDLVRDQDVPDTARVVSHEQLIDRVFSTSADDELVLDLGGIRLLKSQLLQLAEIPSKATLDEEEEKRLWETYDLWKRHGLLLIHLQQSGDEDMVDLRESAQNRIERALSETLVDHQLKRIIRDRVQGESDDVLIRFFHDNAVHFQTSPQFKLLTMDIPFDGHPPELYARLQVYHDALLQGTMDFQQVAHAVHAKVTHHGWVDYEDFPSSIPPKGVQYIVDVGHSGYSVPYHQDKQFHMHWVEERREPKPLAFEDAKDRVVDLYVQRNEHLIYADVLREKMDAMAFVFNEPLVREKLQSSITIAGPGDSLEQDD